MTLLTEAKYEDRCARCLKPCIRVKRVSSRSGSARFVTSCCGVKAIAVRVE